MFTFEAAFHRYRRKHGMVKALEDYADLRDAPMQHPLDGTSSDLAILWPSEPTVLDLNEHFLELSNLRNDELPRWAGLVVVMCFIPLCLLLSGGTLWFLWDVAFVGDPLIPFPPNSIKELGVLLGMLLLAVLGVPMASLLWREFQSYVFTARCARYRFNRTTGKVYVLRPGRWGGNAVLDWSRVQAHVHWVPPAESEQSQEYATSLNDRAEQLRREVNWSRQSGSEVDGSLAITGLLDLVTGFGVPAYDLSDEAREKRRKKEYGGCLLLYWPPLDAADPQRRGEDLIWVGPRNSGGRLWCYIQTFMQKGMDAVQAPAMPSEWLHKGRNPDHVLNWLAECLCYWPVFPVGWNSEVGQIRRENGIGPEQPLTWPAKVPEAV
ncbi:hypothetical protein [Ralstonia mannitolilytica]|uniref:hypothetical protein n=1 Tax=Ralstonia mannitolilytica TaxID=105219 RepID=UPI0013DE5B34|nr:hypothetical protein [Ralstonia mannitolilytica]QIF09260.1 hypothetical protein G5A69_19800 [Ralstonia mannitolilytica]CAJ0780709.1 hypothetical protein R77555_00724 [Ralstonia mannitolilytica]